MDTQKSEPTQNQKRPNPAVTVTRNPAPTRTFQKSNADIIKMEVGDSVEGTYTGQQTGDWLDKATGELKDLTRLYFTRDDGTKFILFQDGGLKNAMLNAGVSEGDYIKIQKLEKTELTGGRSVNQYDIFHAVGV